MARALGGARNTLPLPNLTTLHDMTRETDLIAGNLAWSPDDDFEVVMIRLDQDPDAVRRCATLLCSEERARADRFAFDSDRRRYIVGRAELRRILSARLGVAPRSVKFTYGAFGKPVLANGLADSGVRFNLSHSGNAAVCALTTGRDIGVDLERHRVVPNAPRIAQRFFSRAERASLNALDPVDQSLGFLNCWTRKEAFIKAVGEGLSYPLESFDVSLAPGEAAEILRVGDLPGDQCGWTLHDFSTGGLVGACVLGTDDVGASAADMRMRHSVC